LANWTLVLHKGQPLPPKSDFLQGGPPVIDQGLHPAIGGLGPCHPLLVRPSDASSFIFSYYCSARRSTTGRTPRNAARQI